MDLLLQIFNIALATLQHRLNDLEKVDVHSGEVKFAADYPGFAVKYYSTEDDREKAIKTSFIDPMGGEGMWKKTISYAGETKPDCSWWSNDFLITVIELVRRIRRFQFRGLLCFRSQPFREFIRPNRCHCKSPRNFRLPGPCL